MAHKNVPHLLYILHGMTKWDFKVLAIVNLIDFKGEHTLFLSDENSIIDKSSQYIKSSYSISLHSILSHSSGTFLAIETITSTDGMHAGQH